MTVVKKRQPYRRTMAAEDRVGGGDPRFLCYAAGPLDVSIRLKGTRKTVTIPWDVIWRLALQREAMERNLAKGRRRLAVKRGVRL